MYGTHIHGGLDTQRWAASVVSRFADCSSAAWWCSAGITMDHCLAEP